MSEHLSDRASHQEFWAEVTEAGGPRKYVEAQLRERGVWVKREDVLSMGAKQKQSYIERLKAEELVRRPLQEKVWRTFTALHIVHLGEEVFWQSDVSVDFFDPDNLAARLDQRQLPIIDTPEALSDLLEISLGELRWLCYHREAAKSLHYTSFTIPKKSGGLREIWAPMPKLKAAQHWVLRQIAERLTVHGAAHGFIAGRSIYTNAIEHIDASVIVSMDLANFFPTFTFKRVKGIFRQAGYMDGIATLLALLCTEAPREVIEDQGERFYIAMGPRCLPQGSPASPALTNAACLRLDRRLTAFAEKHGWRYTRYADDLTFSLPKDRGTEAPDLSVQIKQLIGTVHAVTEGEGLKVRTDKTHVMRPGNQQKVTGLVVNGEDHPRAPRALRRKVRAMIHNLKTGKGLHNGDNLNHLTGLIAFIHMCDPQQGQHLLNQLRDACSNQ
jgi:RNA-directed DNA polymerase